MPEFQDSPRELRKCLNVSTNMWLGIILQPQFYSHSVVGSRLILSLCNVCEKRLNFENTMVGNVDGVLELPVDRYIQSECIKNNFCDSQLSFRVEDLVIKRHGG